MRKLRVDHLAGKFPSTLSRGEKQRVAVARAVANDAELIIADEPTASLETEQGLQMIRLLRHLARGKGKCVVVATHDLRLRDHADRVLRLQDGQSLPQESTRLRVVARRDVARNSR